MIGRYRMFTVCLYNYVLCFFLVPYFTGPNPAPSDSESRAIDSLANKLSTKIKSKNNENDTEEALSFDVKSAPRVILHEGKVLKRSHNSVLVTTSKRHMILFNDVLLITSVHSSGAFNTSEKYVIHQILSLDKCSIAVCNKEENPLVFEIQAPDKTYSFVCDREEDKRIWVEELTSAMLSIHYGTRYANYPGWPHEVIRGTLHSAAMMGDADMLSYHIQKCNADDSTVDLFDDQGMCPLHWAALRGHFECVRLLLTGGSDVDILNSGLNSALLMATSRGNDDVLRLLVDHGADLQLRNLKDRDALFMAVLYAHSSKGLPSILNTLNFQGVNLDQLDSTGAAPLHECAARNLPRPVQLLVDAGAAVNTKHGRSGITPLQVACSAKFPDAETVRSFLDKGAFPNWKDAENRSAFELALATHEVSEC